MENCHGGSLDKIFTTSQQASNDSDSDTSSMDGHYLKNNSFCSYENEEDLTLYRKLNSEQQFKKIIRKLLYSIKFLHDIGIVHRDLKLENIMLQTKDENQNQIGDIRIIDLGLSIEFDPEDTSANKFTSVVGTPHYLAPEVIKQEYDEKCDIWALGIVAYLLFSQGDFPFNGENEIQIYKEIRKTKLYLPPKPSM